MGLPTSLSSDLDLAILVADVNDHPPTFEVDAFFAAFTENREPGVERIQLVGTVDK